MIYLDTSALVKRFVAKAGSNRVGRLIVEDASVATAKIAYPETCSGLTRKRR
jgi:predicted nucleic acid-binding protein